ncbi:phenylacetate--CoA ligase PaaK [Saccharomonospora iraqiensis]|uniref:phenylacetate--CoA ligase PaaK n=1 Tax=Saccharomonospora iraqiensis TaxID=52698 RepID=UPI00041A799A|nr:phenylacetate--CoA ligase PaaK [Saccharomonospora iraqiensis]
MSTVDDPRKAPGHTGDTGDGRRTTGLPDGDAAEHLSTDELRARQLQRLRWTLRHAYDTVPFYRERFDRAGVHPDDCRELADLARFPCTTKQDLRDNYPSGLFAVGRDRIRRMHASSGTTGAPTVVGHTEGDLRTWSALVARSIRAAGGRPGQTVHVSYGYGLFTGGLGAHYGAEALGCAVVPASGGMSARQVRLITDLQPEIIMVTPSYLLTLLDEFERQGLDPAASSLRVGILGAEPWTEGMRAEIERRAGIDAVDIYGLSEMMGPGVAQECVETKDGPHIWEDHFLPEILDPETGSVLDDGTLGELTFTTLTREAMPLIRYRTRDLTRLRPGTARPAHRRMDRITGRSDDMIVLRGVNVFPTQIEEIVLATDGLSPHFQLVLSTRQRLDTLTVRVEAADDLPAGDRAGVARRVGGRVADEVGVRVEVDVVAPETLERSVGKMRRVVDERDR